jgi:large subunit ribosomal protein L6
MSKIGKKPITILDGATLSIEGQEVKVNGPKGSLTFSIPAEITATIENGVITISEKESTDNSSALSGLTRALIANMITGVSKGFEKKLELSGVGYRAQAAGNVLTLSVGFSHPVKITADPSISFAVDENIITVSGMDKMLVGNIAAKVREIRPPEPYKGKGIKYQGERIRRKVGKAAKAVGAK